MPPTDFDKRCNPINNNPYISIFEEVNLVYLYIAYEYILKL